MRLSKQEKETITLWNEQDKELDIFTYNAKLIKKLKGYSEKYPEMCYMDRDDNGAGGYGYKIKDKTRLSVNLLKPKKGQRHEKMD